MIEKIRKNKIEIVLVIIILFISAFTHGYNMFHYPYYTNDEGTYMSQAWSVTEEGRLEPYTYWYDHAPAGWLFIATWVKFTGGYFTFGDAVASGRIFMLILHLCITGLLYFITRKLTNSILAPVIAVLLFSLSPLGIYFQRRILLDNIMVFWSMVSIALLLKDKLKMRHIVLSGITFGIAILTKETAVFFIPALLYGVYSYSHVVHRRIALIQWSAIAGCITSLYFFYALLKGELFPVQNGEHRISLLDTLVFQGSRGSGHRFWNTQSDFSQAFITWFAKDPYILVFGIISTALLLIFALRNKKLRMPVFLMILFWGFLMRGGLVIDFYVVPLIPLLALAVGIAANQVVVMLTKNHSLQRILLSLSLVVGIIFPSTFYSLKQYYTDETMPFTAAISWIKENIPTNNRVIIDDSMFVELRNSRDGFIYHDADWFWKTLTDPEIRDEKYKGNLSSAKYIILTHEMLQIASQSEGALIDNALNNSVLVASWGPMSSGTYLNVDQRKSTYGDWVQVYKARDPDEIYLEDAWKVYKKNQIISYGQVIDTSSDGRTTSEGQSYALLRSVWMGDRGEFDGVWNWTKDHMQYRPNDKLFSWLWNKDKNGVYKIQDSETASDADQDIALALLFAYKQWGNQQYLDEAKVIIDDIWKHEVVEVKGQNYLVANTKALRGNAYLLNLSYLSPATYRIFAEVDTSHDWMSVVDSSYQLLNEISANPKNELQLPSDWVMLDANTGATSSAVKYTSSTADQYGYDAFRVMWRVALDAKWYQEPRALEYLQKYNDFFYSQWKEQKLVSVYTADGQSVSASGNISTDIGALSVFSVTDKNLAEEFYQDHIVKAYNEEGYWEEKNNYYGQNWAWFGTGLHKGVLTNLWKKGK